MNFSTDMFSRKRHRNVPKIMEISSSVLKIYRVAQNKIPHQTICNTYLRNYENYNFIIVLVLKSNETWKFDISDCHSLLTVQNPAKIVYLKTCSRDSERQWHQLGHKQICTLTQTYNHTSIPPLSFLQAGCPSCHQPTSASMH